MIDCKNLQLGDWVRILCKETDTDVIGKVFELRQEDVTIDTDGTDDGIWCAASGVLEPIPLTPEILEKNGFLVKHPDNPKRTYWTDTESRTVGHKNRGLLYMEAWGMDMKVDGNPKQYGYFCPHFHGHIYYVHEFQHILRICNITKEIKL